MSQKSIGMVLIGLGAGVILGALVLFGRSWFNPGQSFLAAQADASISPTKGKKAPDFSLTTLSGESVSLSQYAGKSVLINFWATWCNPCKQEMPLIQEYADKYSGDLVVLAVNDAEPESSVKGFSDELGLTIPILLDPGEDIFRQYRVSAYPTSYFIDANGVIQAVHIGLMSENHIKGYLAQIGVGR